MEEANLSSRFAGTIRLFGEDGFGRLQRAHICVVGVGGVGSWAVETLARSGVGMLTLIDGDVVVESNINRQLPALESNLGKPKVSVLAQRIADINPEIDPTRIAICDLSRTQQEPLLAKVRKRLRSQYGFTRNPKNKFGIDAVYSLEPVRYPATATGDDVAQTQQAGFGTTMAVTASFGMAAASYVMRRIAGI